MTDHITDTPNTQLKPDITHVHTHYLVAEGDDTRQEADEDIGVHAALMSFIYDDHTVLLQQEILQNQTS